MLPFKNLIHSPYPHTKEVVDLVTAAIIFIGDAMERPNPSFLLASLEKKRREQIPNTKTLDMGKLNLTLRLDLY